MTATAVGGCVGDLKQHALRIGREPGQAQGARVAQIFVRGKMRLLRNKWFCSNCDEGGNEENADSGERLPHATENIASYEQFDRK